jgi:hypothetical protein
VPINNGVAPSFWARITPEPGRIDEYARRGGWQMVPAILDRDVCVKLVRDGEWDAAGTRLSSGSIFSRW